MKILKAAVFLDQPDGSIYTMDVIKHAGSFWIVPQWNVMPEIQQQSPARIIRLDPLPHQKMKGPPHDFVVNYPIPKAICDGLYLQPTTPPFEVVEAPNIRFSVEPRHLN